MIFKSALNQLPAVHAFRAGKDHGIGFDRFVPEFQGCFVGINLFGCIFYSVLNLCFSSICLGDVFQFDKINALVTFPLLTVITRSANFSPFPTTLRDFCISTNIPRKDLSLVQSVRLSAISLM